MRTKKHQLHHPTLAHTTRQQFRLEHWQRRTLYGIVAALFLSGLAWLVAHYFLRQAGEFGDTIHPLEHWSMQVHGAFIIPMSFFVGSLLLQHIRRAHRALRNRASGWSMLVVLSALALTGYCLYYFATENSRVLWSLAHSVIGASLPVVLYVHVMMGRRAVKS